MWGGRREAAGAVKIEFLGSLMYSLWEFCVAAVERKKKDGFCSRAATRVGMGHAMAGDGSVQALVVSWSANEGGSTGEASDSGVGQPSGREVEC